MHALILCACLAAEAAGRADDRPPVGLWELTYYAGLQGQNELWTNWIIDLHVTDGKLHGRVVTTNPAQRGSELERVEWQHGRLRLKLTPNAEDQKSAYRSTLGVEFEGVPAARPEDGFVGILGADYPARLVRRDSPQVPKGFTGRQYFPPLQKAMETLKEIRSVVNPTAFRDKAKLEAAARAGDQVLDRAIPQLEAALGDPDSRAAVEAAKFLVRQDVARKQPVARLAPWARAGEKAARAYGPRHHAECTAQLAAAIPPTAETAPLILELIQAAEESLDEADPLDLHCRVLWVKDAALRAAGDHEACAGLNQAWQKVEKRVQDRHREQRPLPKLTGLEAPPVAHERPAVLELVATPSRSDDGSAVLQAAFDGLAATFGDRAIVYEYGWFPHNPRPPARLVHPGAIAEDAFRTRLWVQKQSAFPLLLNGQFVFNLKIKTSGSSAQEIYDVLHAEMASTLGKGTEVRLNATAARRGDKVEVQTRVEGLSKPGTVAVLLAEDWAYTAWPGLIFSQHRVVRIRHETQTGNGGLNRFELDLAKLERDLAPVVEGLPAWDVLNPSGTAGDSYKLVRAGRWNEPYVIVLVWAQGELQQAAQVRVSGF